MDKIKDMSVRTGGGTGLTHGRMPCPNCSNPISFPFESLFLARPIWCSTCGTQLSVDPEASKNSLRMLQEGLTRLKATRDAAGSGG